MNVASPDAQGRARAPEKDNSGEHAEFQEYPLARTYKLAFEWTPDGLESLLDAGCAWGYGTRFFRTKAKHVCGLDPSQVAIDVARERYPDIGFEVSHLESTPFDSQAFDAIVCCETLEHVDNDVACLSEIHRLLKPRGVAVITTPHRGLLGFMDPDNYGQTLLKWAKRRVPALYRLYRRHLSSRPYNTEEPAAVEDGAAPAAVHRHYTLDDYRRLLDESAFRGRYELVRVFRSGFLMEMLVTNIHFWLRRVLRGRWLAAMESVFARVIALDYRTPYHSLSNNVAIQIVKTE